MFPTDLFSARKQEILPENKILLKTGEKQDKTKT